jgi:hypothetical protein
MSGRIVGVEASPIEIAPLHLVTDQEIPPAEEAQLDTHQQLAATKGKESRSTPAVLTEEVIRFVEGEDSLVELFKQYGYEADDTVCTRDLLKFPTITYALHTHAKKISGLLSNSARQADNKAAYSLADLIALAVYSARPKLFDSLVDLTLEELQERHDTTARTLTTIVRDKLEEHAATSAA